ncbi:MAG TPA: hypothetical protein VIF62_17395 [Labilithrix sp.]|jgi:hypothetical protein
MTLAKILGIGVLAALAAACGQAADDASAAGGDQAYTGSGDVPIFADTASAGTKVTFEHSPGQPSVVMRGASAGLKPALDELNRQAAGNNSQFTAASFAFDPKKGSQYSVLDSFASLKGHSCDLDPLQLAFDAMFFSMEPKRDGEDQHNALTDDSMSCQLVTAQAATNKHGARTLQSGALKAFRAGSAYAALVDPSNDPKIGSSDLAKLVASSTTSVQSLMKGMNAPSIYSCDWSNGDDETATAVFAVDPKSGEVRVLFGYVGP